MSYISGKTKMKEPLDLKKPETFGNLFRQISGETINGKQTTEQAYGLFMKYMAEMVPAYIADCERQGLNSNALVTGALNTFANALGFMMSAGARNVDEAQAATINTLEAFVQVFAQNMQANSMAKFGQQAVACDCPNCAPEKHQEHGEYSGSKKKPYGFLH